MDRRNFIKVSALCAGAVAAGETLSNARSKEKVHTVQTPLEVLDYIEEPRKRLPVVAAADIVVVGGGPSGVAAAVSAARHGADVLMIEKNNFLGGLWTGGLVLPVIDTHGRNSAGDVVRTMGGFGRELCDRLDRMGMSRTDKGVRPVVDPEGTKYVLDSCVIESGVRMLYHSYVTGVLMSGDRIEAVILESKSGRCAVKTGMVVDCSGDGDIIEWSGENFEKREENIGMMWRAGNVTLGKGVTQTPIDGVVNMHMVGEKADGLDVFKLTELQQRFRMQMWDKTMALREKDGCENAFLLETPHMIGVRITRVLDSRHNVSNDEYRKFVSYDDVVAMGGSSRGRYPMWQIPYRALTPKKCPNLIVGGRCFGFGTEVTYDAREIATCLVTGQAAGTAAAIANSSKCSIQEVDVAKLQHALRAAGVILDY